MQAPLQARNDSDAAQTDTARTVAQKRVLADNRPEALAKRKLAEMMNNSPRVLQQRALSDAIHNSPRMVAQRHEMNALFGGAIKPQEGGAMPAEALPMQHKERMNNTGLPDRLKSGIESLSGVSMDHVKVHYNSDKPAQLQAHAYAQGNEIHLGAGQERHLPHEAWHVVQQAQGRVRPTLQLNAGTVNDDPSLEQDADMMGEKAARFEGGHVARNLVAEERAAGALSQSVAGFAKSLPAQRVLILNGRNVNEKNLFDGAAFKDRLTKQIDKHASNMGMTRDQIRNVVIDLISSDAEHTYSDIGALLTSPVFDNNLIDHEMDGREAEENWVVFGIDGKSKKQLEQALRIGYRNFDCAESYGNTAILAQLTTDTLIDRDEFSITYKFSLRNGESSEALTERLTQVATSFGGYIDQVIIHSLDASEEVIKRAWGVLQTLKTDGVFHAVGLGNLNEGHEHLLQELGRDGKVDVIENSLSSVLASPELMGMIKASGGELMYYDVMRTANEMGIGSVDGIRAIVAATVTQMDNTPTRMILSSGNVGRNISNFKNFGEGKDQEYDWSSAGVNEAITTLTEWQKGQSAVAENDNTFVLADVVRDQLHEASKLSGDWRERIKHDAGGDDNVNQAFVRQWLNTNTPLTTEVLNAVRVPARTGLRKRYLGMPLGDVMVALLGLKNCDWKWSIELVQMMIADPLDWDAFLRETMDEIVVK